MTTTHKEVTEEELQRVTMLMVFTAGVYLGYKLGWRNGRTDLMHGLERAQRIIQSMKNKE